METSTRYYVESGGRKGVITAKLCPSNISIKQCRRIIYKHGCDDEFVKQFIQDDKIRERYAQVCLMGKIKEEKNVRKQRLRERTQKKNKQNNANQ